MRTYGMSHPQVMELPMPVFWHLSGTVPRLEADRQRDLLEVQLAVNTEGGVAALQQRLDALAPDPVVMSVKARIAATAVRDQEGFESLRSLAG